MAEHRYVGARVRSAHVWRPHGDVYVARRLESAAEAAGDEDSADTNAQVLASALHTQAPHASSASSPAHPRRVRGGARASVVPRSSPSQSSSSYSTRTVARRPGQPWYKEKTSIGVACCRFYRGRPQIIMIQKRYTYAYSSFVHGAYEGGGDRAILALLNQMTVDEKIILQSLNFDLIWAHIWLTQSPHDTQKYRIMRGIFDAAFVRDGNSMRLHDLIARSVHGMRVWEIPKGRTRKGEADIHCAVREFYEETGIEKSQYYIYPNATRSHTFVDDGVQYVQKYYIASTHRPIQPRICLDARVQIEEVADIRWMSIDDIRFVDQSGRLERLIRPIFNYIKKRTIRV